MAAAATARTRALHVSEKDFQEWVVDVAQHAGWLVVHFGVATTPVTDDGEQRYLTPARYDGPGFPDLILIKPGFPALVWFRELKTDKGRLDDAQRKWQIVMESGGVNYMVWRPSQRDEIVQQLNGGRRIVGGAGVRP